MNHAAVRAPKAAARAWRMRAWPSDATVAHLIFLDHQHPPTTDQVADAIDHARRKGARAVRTSAMFPDATRIVLGGGFEPIDRLALLHRDLTDTWHTDEVAPRTRPMRSWHLSACARIDRDSFGLLWGNSPASLRDIRNATPAHRARVVRQGRDIVGFAVAGAAADTGYLQRLAVSPDQRRRGVAQRLVTDSLTWMRQQGATTAMVNTGVENQPALALYRALGFVTLPDELTIAELRLA